MHYCNCGCGTVIRGYGYRCPRGTVWSQNHFQGQFGFLAEMEMIQAEVEVAEDLARGDFAAAAFDSAAAAEFAQGDFVGGMFDEALGDFL